MKSYALLMALLAAPSCATASGVTFQLVRQEQQVMTGPIVFIGSYDVYSIVATNPTDLPIVSLQFNLVGDFLQTGGVTFGSGPENPIFFGFEAPDTFFSLPEGVDASLALGVDIVDTPTQLSGAYTTQGGLELVPANGSAPVVTISVPSGRYPLNLAKSYADLGGAGGVLGSGRIPILPEPSTVLMVGIVFVGLAGVRR